MMSVLSRLEADPPPERLALALLTEELAEWLERELAWRREYPALNPPSEWTRRGLTPDAHKRLRRKIRGWLAAH
jgi:hypothetical protein